MTSWHLYLEARVDIIFCLFLIRPPPPHTDNILLDKSRVPCSVLGYGTLAGGFLCLFCFVLFNILVLVRGSDRADTV